MKLPEIDQALFFDKVIEERQNGVNATFFNQIKNHWKKRVEDYHINGGNPEIILPDPQFEAKKGTLKNLYTSPAEGAVQKPMLESLRCRDLQFCPCCGEMGTPNTLDHYLPKEGFPEFSILSSNLYPMCDICQLIKRTDTLNEDGTKKFIHPYYDSFAEARIVEMSVSGPFDAPPAAQLSPHSALSPEEAILVASHVLGLNIHRRFNKFFKDQYLLLLKSVASMRAGGVDIVGTLKLFGDMESFRSVNSWTCVFYDGILANRPLLNYMESGDLPDFL